MSLDWDVLLDDVSIKTQIAGFQVREVKGAYARELTLFAADPTFYEQFDYTVAPLLRIEVKTKIATTWISQGKFYIERPGIFANPDSILSTGEWGRSETAKAGPPFAQKVSKTWTEDTTCQDIITEMADLCDLTVTFETDNYTIFANSYAVDGIYPIDVISELAAFSGAHLGCTPAGVLVIKSGIFHPGTADYTITDADISDITEQLEYPEFGNRVRISAIGAGAGYQVDLQAIDNADCLPADGTTSGILLAFVTGTDGEPVAGNTIVSWSIEEGASLEEEDTGTGTYLFEDRKHRAKNYYNVDVEFPVSSVVGVWAYADAGGNRNFWDNGQEGCTFEGKTITVQDPFDYCDQLLRVVYTAAGCSVNKVTAGSTTVDVIATAEVNGAEDTLLIKQGNTCACGSSLRIKSNPSDPVCLGNAAHILVWATINKKPATGKDVKIRVIEGCGELSSENKKLKTVEILNESAQVNNVVAGVSRVTTDIAIAAGPLPGVYRTSDESKSSDLYLSHDGKEIDLSEELNAGEEVLIDYTADGATLVSWRTLDETKECDAEIAATMEDGTEAGLRETVSVSTRDCTVAEEGVIPMYNEEYSIYDPVNDDQRGGQDGGFSSGEGSGELTDGEASGALTDCGPNSTVSNRLIEDTMTEEQSDGVRFDVTSAADCPEEGRPHDCSCNSLCWSEIYATGNTQDYSETLHEQASALYDPDTPEYHEEYERLKTEHMGECEQNCADARGAVCDNCDSVSGPSALAPGESAEYVCEDGTTGIVTMPVGACGTQTFTVGCCSFKVRSTDGQWVTTEYWEATCGYSHSCDEYDYYEDAGTWIVGSDYCSAVADPACTDIRPPRGDNSNDCGSPCYSTDYENMNRTETTKVWECI